ncbi:hypothetical protein EXO10_23140, partial [Salmonella enterica]|nr:hypothetical protein [Salmonella enterica]
DGREIFSRSARCWTSRRRVSGFSRFRGAALNQSRSASGVYTGLKCYNAVMVYESASCGTGKCSTGV